MNLSLLVISMTRQEFNMEQEGSVRFDNTSEMFFVVVDWYKKHKETCNDIECQWCAMWYCPYSEPLHNHHDGCPACDGLQNNKISILDMEIPTMYDKVIKEVTKTSR